MMKRIICYGDSNTYGYDPRSFMGGRYDKENRWPGILEKSLGCDIINLGQNGREIPTNEVSMQNLAYTFAQGLKNCETRLLVMLGVNDILFGKSPEKAAQNMDCFLEKTIQMTAELSGFDTEFVRKRTTLICPPAVDLGAWVDEPSYIEKVARLGELLAEIATKYGMDFVDARKWSIDLTYDGVHFSKLGNATFAKNILRYCEELI